MKLNSIYCGDCQRVLGNTLEFPDESIDLIYADPPFFSNKHYEVLWGDGYELRAFEDRWKGGIENYIAWMEPKIRECHRVLKNSGAMYLHCDWHANAHLRILMDQIFGPSNFRNEIQVKRIRKNVREYTDVKKLNTAYDSILLYAKSPAHRIKPPMKEDHRPERWHSFIANEYRTGMDYELFGIKPDKSHHWRWTKERAMEAIKDGRLRANPKTGTPEYLISESTHSIVSSAWDDIPAYSFKSGYPTEKSEELLTRIIEMSSKEGDIVLDPFCGCGTAIITAEKLKRKWIGIDVSPTSCRLMAEKLRKYFKIGIGENDIIGMPKTEEDMKRMPPFEFQNWVIGKLMGRVSVRKTGDMGIDGYLFDGSPIQVKQSEDIGRNVVDNFETAIRRAGKNKGIIVAISFGKGAYEEVARVRNQEGLDITLMSLKELIELE
jgi:DNA modification methylase